MEKIQHSDNNREEDDGSLDHHIVEQPRLVSDVRPRLSVSLHPSPKNSRASLGKSHPPHQRRSSTKRPQMPSKKRPMPLLNQKNNLNLRNLEAETSGFARKQLNLYQASSDNPAQMKFSLLEDFLLIILCAFRAMNISDVSWLLQRTIDSVKHRSQTLNSFTFRQIKLILRLTHANPAVSGGRRVLKLNEKTLELEDVSDERKKSVHLKLKEVAPLKKVLAKLPDDFFWGESHQKNHHIQALEDDWEESDKTRERESTTCIILKHDAKLRLVVKMNEKRTRANAHKLANLVAAEEKLDSQHLYDLLIAHVGEFDLSSLGAYVNAIRFFEPKLKQFDRHRNLRV